MSEDLVPRAVRGAVIAAGVGGLGFALLVNVGASIHWRAEANREGIRMVLASVLSIYLIGENFTAR